MHATRGPLQAESERHAPLPGNTSPLSRYRALALELAAIIRSVLDRAREQRNERMEARARRLLRRLSEDRFHLAVVGQHKRGKSSLMNAMIGRNLLPTGILPVTSAIIALHYDSELKVRIHDRTESGRSSGFEMRLEDLPEYVSEQGNPGNRRNVECAEVGVPAELLRSGFYFVDTPGIGSAIAANTVTTRAFLPEVDAAIFVTSFDSPMNEIELAFLDNVRQYVSRMFFVINKSDLVSAEERDEVVRFVERRIAERTGDANLRLHVVSAAREIASLSNSPGAQRDNGIAELTRDLAGFLVNEKAQEFLLRIAARSADLLDTERLEDSLFQSAALERSPEALDHFRAALVDAADRATERAETLMRGIRSEVLEGLRNWCETRIESFCATERASAEDELSAFFRPSHMFLSPWEAPDFFPTLRQQIEKRASQWLHDGRDEMDNVARRAVQPHTAEIESLVASLLPVASETLGLHLESPANEAGSDEISLPPLRLPASAPRLEWKWTPPVWSYAAPARLVARRLTGLAAETLRASLGEFRTSVLNEVAGAGERWVQELQTRIETPIRTQARNLEEIAERGPTNDANQTRSALIDSEMNKLAAIEQEIRNTRAAPSDIPASPASSDRTRQPCPVCRRAVASLYKFLAEFQYELAVDERARFEHVRRGGFCPLHTWMYESIASPQGMSTGYAPVLEHAAQQLHSVPANAESDSIVVKARRLVPGPDQCQACQLVENAEAGSLAKEAVLIDSGKDTSLCLLHLARALELVRDDSTRRKAASQTAEDLARIAEDMRMFALKTDAFRHDLTVSDESNAYRLALQKLAGQKNLAVARRVY